MVQSQKARAESASHARRSGRTPGPRVARVHDEGARSGLKTSGAGKVVIDEGYRSGLKVAAQATNAFQAHRQASSTYRERREAKAARLREWAAKREAKAAAEYERGHQMAEAIPLGEPIHVGHYSEQRDRNYRAWTWGTMDKAVEDSRKAAEMRSRAANIEAANARAIYSDDENAAALLRERIAGLKAERERIKAYNTSARAGHPDESLLDE